MFRGISTFTSTFCRQVHFHAVEKPQLNARKVGLLQKEISACLGYSGSRTFAKKEPTLSRVYTHQHRFSNSRSFYVFKRCHFNTGCPSFSSFYHSNTTMQALPPIAPLSKVRYSTTPSKSIPIIKKLPLGISSIEKILQGDYLYIDKTELVLQVIQEGSYYFLSRPRRFGKTLLMNTLELILSGNKEIFKNCSIYNTDYSWEKHPVVHLDFSSFPAINPQNLEQGLKDVVKEAAYSHGITVRGSSPEMNLVSLVKELSVKGKVAVLIDEYDKPIVDNLNNLELAENNRDRLKIFFGCLKSLDNYLTFVFITGVAKFSHVSLFSGLNNLTDITMDPRYAQLLGYTEDEIQKYFSPHIQAILKKYKDQKGKASEQEILEELKVWYNGYRFASDKTTVYNPDSILRFMRRGEISSHWYRTGTPSFLIEYFKKNPPALISVSGGVKVDELDFFDCSRLDRLEYIPLMFQTGYLTIREYDINNESYTLDFPNKEVQKAFFSTVLKQFVKLESRSDSFMSVDKIRQDLALYNLKSFFLKINTFFSKIPYQLFDKGQEKLYHAILLALIGSLGIKVHAEDATNLGRIDISFEISNAIYIIECKLDQNAKVALKQAELNKYKQKYLYNSKPIVVVGVNFSSKTRDINEWQGQVYSSEGNLIQEILPTKEQNTLPPE